MSDISPSYAEAEYGLSATQMKVIAKKLHAKARKARMAGKSKVLEGDLEVLLFAIRRGEEAADTGRTIPHEEVKKLLSSWTTK